MIVTYVNPWRMGGPPRYATGYGGLLPAIAVPLALDIFLEKYFPTDPDTVREQIATELAPICADLGAQPPKPDTSSLFLAGLAGAALGAAAVYFSRKR